MKELIVPDGYTPLTLLEPGNDRQGVVVSIPSWNTNHLRPLRSGVRPGSLAAYTR